MTNLEFYKDDIKEISNISSLVCAICKVKNKGVCTKKIFCEYDYFNANKAIDWLCKEHKEPIKLKQWEYDLLKLYDLKGTRRFKCWNRLNVMKEKGHFKGITDTNMTIEDILDNCKIVADDYDFGGNK